MKTKFLFILVLLFCVYQAGYAQWYNQKFQIGSFADPRISRDNNKAKDSISFSLFKAAKFNLLTGPQYYNGGAGFDLMDKTLDWAARNGLHLMIIDSKLSVTNDNFSPEDAQKIISHFKTTGLSKRNAMGGYSFGGEFPNDKAPEVKKWISYFQENDTEKPAFVYLLPSYGFNNRSAYEAYLDNYLNDGDNSKRPQIVAYDFYPFLSTKILGSYFYNLGIIKEKAQDRPFWYYIQSTTKKTLPDITDYQLRFMAFCPLAYGAKGAIYYTYESIPDKFGLNYYDALINPYGNVTKKYYTAKIINYYLSSVAGPIIMQNKCVGTFHVSNNPTRENIPDKYILPKNNQYVSTIGNNNILVGIFKNERPDMYFLMIINKSESNAENVSVNLPGSKSVTELAKSENYKGQDSKTILPVRVANNSTSFTIDRLGAGEMTIVQISQK